MSEEHFRTYLKDLKEFILLLRYSDKPNATIPLHGIVDLIKSGGEIFFEKVLWLEGFNLFRNGDFTEVFVVGYSSQIAFL